VILSSCKASTPYPSLRGVISILTCLLKSFNEAQIFAAPGAHTQRLIEVLYLFQRVHSQGILVKCEWRGDGDRSVRGRTGPLQADLSFLIRPCIPAIFKTTCSELE